MGFFNAFLLDYPYLTLAQGALTVWMLVDASRRQPASYWFWVILVFQPFGAWAYFFTYKVGELGGLPGFSFLQRRASLAELHYQVELRPTLATHLALAERLVESREYGQAVPHLEAAMAREPEHCQVLYFMALCHTELGRPEKAIPLLEQILRRDRRWSDYKAWRLLVTARDQAGDKPGALQASRDLARLSPSLEHHCLLAKQLLAQGQHDEAYTLLDRALQDHNFAPGPVRRRDRPWAKEARRLQKRVPTA